MSASSAPLAFAVLVDQFVREQCQLDPITSSFLGLRDWDRVVPDTSAAGWRHRDDRRRFWIRAFEAVDATPSTADRIDRELVLARLGAEMANANFESWRRAPEPYCRDGVFEIFVHRGRPEPEAVAAAIARLAHVPQTVADAKANLTADLAHPVILTRGLGTVKGAAEFLRTEVGSFVSDPALRAQLETAVAPAAAAYDDLAAHIRTLTVIAHGSYAFGEQRYDTLLRVGEQLGFTVQSLREMGRIEYAGLDAEMGDVARRISGTSDWKTALASLQRRHAADMPALLNDYRDATTRARRFIAERGLMTMPPDEGCAVQPAPAFLRAAVAVASYFPPAPFIPGSRGTFNVPFTPDDATTQDMEDRLESNAHYGIAATTAHETYPGHHAHFARIANASVLRQLLQSEYFTEGWALYAEKMMSEQGFYRSDEELLGQLAARIMRAARVVVDTSLHMGEMSIEQAADFMRVQVGLPNAVARSEAERYASWPGQASSYMTGAIAIEGYRDRWLAERRGSLCDFHDAITSSGALPLGLAARAIGLD